MSAHSKLLKEVQQENQDFEWYPTSSEIIKSVYMDLVKSGVQSYSILDCGAGNGKVLTELKKLGEENQSDNGLGTIPSTCYAIEKSQVLIDSLPSDIFVIGTDFYSQTLIDKDCDVIFCNPIYSDFENWATRLILEGKCDYIYLVIPQRWQSSDLIQDALSFRKAQSTVIMSYDFMDSEDRKARTRVDVIRIRVGKKNAWNESRFKDSVDPFDLWFETHFKLDKKEKTTETEKEDIRTEIDNKLVKGGTLIEALESLYNAKQESLLKNYLAACELDPLLLNELGVNSKSIKEALKLKIANLKDIFWRELFNNLDSITSKLTKSSREKLLETLTSRTSVDFSAENIYAVVIWAMKNCNHYYDTQLIEVFETMLEKANTKLYKSNNTVFNWNHGYNKKDLSHVKLDHRIVLSRICGGIEGDSFYAYKATNGLKERGANFVNDVVTIANNLGFHCEDQASSFEWSSGSKSVFRFYSHKTNKIETLMEVKAFLNNNLHIKFNKSFIFALNVEMGRLKSWVRNANEASQELEIPIEEAKAYFKSNLVIESKNLSNLLPAPNTDNVIPFTSSNTAEQQALDL